MTQITSKTVLTLVSHQNLSKKTQQPYFSNNISQFHVSAEVKNGPYMVPMKPLIWQFQTCFLKSVSLKTTFNLFYAQFHIKNFPKRPNNSIFGPILGILDVELQSKNGCIVVISQIQLKLLQFFFGISILFISAQQTFFSLKAASLEPNLCFLK